MTPQTTFVGGVSPWGKVITQVAKPYVPAIKTKPVKVATPVKAKAAPRIRRTPRALTGKRAMHEQGQQELVDLVAANPGLTHREIAELMQQDHDAIRGRIKYLVRAGRLHATIKPGKFGVIALIWPEPQDDDGVETTMPYNIRVSRQQRITIAKMGGPDAIRAFIDAQTERMNHAQNLK